MDTPSISVDIKPTDSRCHYWAKVLRAGTALPLPEAVTSGHALPGAFYRRGNEELAPGDAVIHGQQAHHRKLLGYVYRMDYCDAQGRHLQIRPRAAAKTALKASGMPIEHLRGAGDLAALVRVLIGLRMGTVALGEAEGVFVVPTEGAA
jgi:hypothetical protein